MQELQQNSSLYQTGYTGLVGAVFAQAIEDGCTSKMRRKRFTCACTKKEKRNKLCTHYKLVTNEIREDARRWINGNLSLFPGYCRSVGLNPQYMRNRINKIYNAYDEKTNNVA